MKTSVCRIRTRAFRWVIFDIRRLIRNRVTFSYATHHHHLAAANKNFVTVAVTELPCTAEKVDTVHVPLPLLSLPPQLRETGMRHNESCAENCATLRISRFFRYPCVCTKSMPANRVGATGMEPPPSCFVCKHTQPLPLSPFSSSLFCYRRWAEGWTDDDDDDLHGRKFTN